MFGKVLGIFVLMLGLSGLLNGHLFVGFILIIGGLLYIPEIMEFLAKRLNFVPKKIYRRASIAVSLIVFVVFSINTPREPTAIEEASIPEPKDEVKVDPKKQAESLAANEFVSDLETELPKASSYPEFLVIRDRSQYARSRFTDADVVARLDAIDASLAPKIADHEAAFLAEKNRNLAQQQRDLARLKSRVKSDFEIKPEEIRNARFLTHKRFKGLRTNVGAYLVADIKEGSTPILRFKAMYYGNDWIFVDSMRFKCADQSFYFSFPRFGEQSFSRDNSGGSVWEYVDVIPTSGQLDLLRCAANSENRVLYSFEGKQYRKDVTMNKPDQKAIADTLMVFDNFQSLGF